MQSTADKRTRYLTRLGALRTERQSWISQWQDISQYILPRSGRYVVTDANKGDRRHGKIYDSTGTRALRVLSAGLMAGMTSPARPWFRLATADPDLMEYAPVKTWLQDVTTLMRDIFQRSNTYRALHALYEELGAFGTASSLLLPDFEDVVRHYPLTAGQYMIATDSRGEVSTLYREFQMTVSQMVEQFGRDAVSQQVRNLFDTGNGLDTWVRVTQVIEPRRDRDPKMRDAANMPFASCYFETGGDGPDKILRESGFEDFPALAPRWRTTGDDVYGEGPGAEALGDIRQLQQEQLRKAQGIDYQTKPPLQVPTAYKNREIDTLPGGVSYVDQTGPHDGIRSAFDVRLELNHLLADIQDVRQRIREAFYSDLFLLIATDKRNQRATAAEIAETHEEKLIMLGPVLERLHNELLKPKVDLTFVAMLRAGIVPPPPQELQGLDLNVEFVSMLAQAQRAVGLASVDRLVGTVGQIAAAKGDPALWDKLDTDQIVDAYSDMLGVDPTLIVADNKVALIREQRAQAQQAAQQAAALEQAAGTAKDLAAASTSGQNALTDVTRAFSGYV